MAKKMNNSQINDAFYKLVEEFEDFKSSVNQIKSEAQQKLNEFNSFQTIKNQEIQGVIQGVEEQKARLNNYYDKLFTDEDSIENTIEILKDDIKSYHHTLIEGDETDISLKDKIAKAYNELSGYKKELLGYNEKQEGGEIIKHPGLKGEIEDLIEKYKAKIKSLDEDSVKLLSEKEEEMDNLLFKMGLNYNAVEQEALSKKFFELSKNKEESIKKSTLLLTLYSILLTGALMFLFTNGTLKELFNKENIIAGALIRIAITVPVMYLIVNTSSRIKRDIAIRDQYNFKGSMMSSYRNISTHIKNEEIGINSIKQTELLEKVFNTMLENEADKLEKSNRFSIRQYSKFISGLAKDLGTDKETLLKVFPDMMNKLNEKTKTIVSAKTTPSVNDGQANA